MLLIEVTDSPKKTWVKDVPGKPLPQPSSDFQGHIEHFLVHTAPVPLESRLHLKILHLKRQHWHHNRDRQRRSYGFPLRLPSVGPKKGTVHVFYVLMGYSASRLINLPTVASIPIAPSGAVTTMDTTAIVRTTSPQESPIARGTPPIAA